MPELPEVETMVRGVKSHLAGHDLIELSACPCRCRPLTITPRLSTLKRRVEGTRIVAVSRLAKRIVLEFAHGDRLVIEPRMTGLMLLADPPDPEHLRLQFVTRRGRRLQSCWFWDRRGLGTVTLYSPTEWDRWRARGVLGPDALEISLDDWRTRLLRVNRELKVALLDQKLVSGIGNLYASEILHLARVHPTRRTNQLSPTELKRLYDANRSILLTAIDNEGSTLSDGTYRNALNKQGGYQNMHRVYDRADETCSTCRRGTIVRIVQAQRSTFFCPRCQVELP